MLFVHATSFCGRIWDDLIARFPDHHAIAVDLRGHGFSQDHEAIRDWRDFGEDIAQFIERAKLPSYIGVAHSLGGHALIEGASKSAEQGCERLVLLDPVVAAPDIYADPPPEQDTSKPHPVINRRRHFANRQEFQATLAPREPFSLFSELSLSRYCEFGLLPRRDGGAGYELACTPETESLIYTTVLSQPKIFDLARSITVPTLVVRAMVAPGKSFMSSVTWPGLASIFPEGRDLQFGEWTHFFPLAEPAETARLIRREIEAVSPSGATRV